MGNVTITPEPEHLQDTAKRLLDAADDPSQVATDTSGRSTAFVVPEEVAELAGFTVPEDDDAAVGDDDTLIGDHDVQEPPRSGKGSGKDVWRDFLTSAGITIPEDATERDDLIDVWDNHRATGD